MDIYEENVDHDFTKQLDSKFRHCYAKCFDFFGTFSVTSNVILHSPKTPFGEYPVPCLSVSIIFEPKTKLFQKLIFPFSSNFGPFGMLHFEK